MTTATQPSRLREAALDFLRLAGPEGNPAEAYEKHVARDFRHHNPGFAAGRDALLQAMTDSAKDHPLRSLEPMSVLVDGDRVAVHSRIRLASGGELATVHLFRFAGDKIAELWDVVQSVPAASPNRDGMF